MWKKRSVAFLIYTIATLQVLGYGFLAWSDGTSFSNYLFLNTGLEESVCKILSQGTIVLMLLLILWAFFKWSPWPFFTLGFLFLTEAIFRTIVGGEFGSAMAITAQAARYLWLLAVGYALFLHRTVEVQRTLPVISLLCRIGLALTFITHGVDAIKLSPHFIDLIIVATRKFAFLPDTESFARSALILIGITDIVCGIWALLRPQRQLLYYMSFWGILTALSRIIFNPYRGIFEALLRASHGGLPLLILLLNGVRQKQGPSSQALSSFLKRSKAS